MFLRKRDTFTGAAEDTRSAEEKAKDFRIEELVDVAAAVNFSQTDPKRWKIYPLRNQDGSGTCVAQTIAKMAGILREQKHGEFIEFSAAPIYNNRVNKPQAGMVGVDALNIWRNKGVTLEALVPSQDMNDAQIGEQYENEYEKEVGELSKLDAYVVLPAGDFNMAVSTMLATGKPLMVWFKGEYDEWSQDVPTILYPEKEWRNGAPFTVHHSVTGTPNIGVYKGAQGFTIEDQWGSAGINGTGVRFITREFYEARNTFCAYPTTFKTYKDLGVDPAKPTYKFTRTLKYGMERDEDVKKLQDVLKYKGYFPANVTSTGNYYEVTRRAVLALQTEKGVDHQGTYGRIVGAKTRAALNSL